MVEEDDALNLAKALSEAIGHIADEAPESTVNQNDSLHDVRDDLMPLVQFFAGERKKAVLSLIQFANNGAFRIG